MTQGPAVGEWAQTDPVVERVAEAIYDAMREHDPEGRQRPWIAGGNSIKQDEARARARAALPTPLSAPEATSDA